MAHLRPGRVRRAVPRGCGHLARRPPTPRSPETRRGAQSPPAPSTLEQPCHVACPSSLGPRDRSLASSVVTKASSAGEPGTQPAPTRSNGDVGAAATPTHVRARLPRHVTRTPHCSHTDVTRRQNVAMRRFVPWALLVVLVIGGAAGAALGISAHDGPAPAPAVTTNAQVPQFAGLTVRQALQLARSRGVSVRIWRLPASVAAGTVMEQLSEPAGLPGRLGRPTEEPPRRCCPTRSGHPSVPSAHPGSGSTPTAMRDRRRARTTR